VTDDSGNVTGDSGKLPKIGHDKTECAVTIIQNRRSRSNGMGGHDRAEYALETLEGNRGHLDGVLSIDQASNTLREFLQ